ncbi:UNVERIFIED_CONTAM: hypothetical protein Slati_0673500 [Sesamum latifolium]|uniref:Uncharacterized protein n=1 Tax=Sesamum latifolium TaxID=2727402 RepID=A0AAW2Y443_9LAMI
MVSIRRRRLLGLCSGQNSFLAPLSRVLENGHTPDDSVENTKPGSVHPLPLNDDYMPKERSNVESDTGGSTLKTRNHVTCEVSIIKIGNGKLLLKSTRSRSIWEPWALKKRLLDCMTEGQRRTGPGSRRKSQNDEWAGEPGQSASSASEDGTFAP